MTAPHDPTASLEAKLLDFSATLSDDEVTVLHEVFHLAGLQGGDVEGFAVKSYGLADPCDGGEVTFPNTFAMLGNLHVALHTRRGSGRRR